MGASPERSPESPPFTAGRTSSAPSLGPVGNASLEALWRPPEGPSLPKGYDVLARAGWFPIVTGLQEVFDLAAGFSAPSGYGHNYAIDFVSGWAAVVLPVRWTEADSARLQQHLAPE